jgi:TRAP-type C4-dicarboxylate transport system permease small subunit
VLDWFVNLLIVMAFGYISRITFQALNINYFAKKSNLSIWILFPFGWGTALVPIGFTCFVFRYYESTSLSQFPANRGSNNK